MVLELNLIKEIKKSVLNLIKLKKEITINILREELIIKFNDLDWKKIKSEIKFEIQRIMTEQDSGEVDEDEEVEVVEVKPVKKEKEKKKPTTSKYEKAASKNLAIFTAMVAGPSYSDDEEEQEDEEEEEYSNSGSAIEIIEEKQQSNSSELELEIQEPPKKKQRKSTTSTTNSKSTNNYLSKEIISDSDEEAKDGPSKIPRIRPPSPVKSTNKSKSTSSSSTKTKKVETGEKKKTKRKSKSNESDSDSEDGLLKFEKKSLAPPRNKKKVEPKSRTRVLKEGDAPLGTEVEESKLKSLKTLLAKAGTPRPFNLSTGAERTLTVKERFDRICNCFKELGVVASRDGKLPNGEKCKEVGEKRALEKEMNELKGVPIILGLRGGKKLINKSKDGDDEEESSEEEEVKSSKHVSAKAFAAFLGDQSSSDDG